MPLRVVYVPPHLSAHRCIKTSFAHCCCCLWALCDHIYPSWSYQQSGAERNKLISSEERGKRKQNIASKNTHTHSHRHRRQNDRSATNAASQQQQQQKKMMKNANHKRNNVHRHVHTSLGGDGVQSAQCSTVPLFFLLQSSSSHGSFVIVHVCVCVQTQAALNGAGGWIIQSGKAQVDAHHWKEKKWEERKKGALDGDMTNEVQHSI